MRFISWVPNTHKLTGKFTYLLYREEEKYENTCSLPIVTLVVRKYNPLKFSNATLTAYNNKTIADEKFTAVIQTTNTQNDAGTLSAIVKEHK